MNQAVLAKVAVVLAVVWQCVMGSQYAVRTPLWQAPDEPAHFNYARELAQTGRLPVLAAGDYDQAHLELLKSTRFRPDLSIDGVRYEGHQPPAYYLLAAGAILLAGSNLRDQVVAARLVSVALGATLIILIYGTISLLTGDGKGTASRKKGKKKGPAGDDPPRNDPWLPALAAWFPALIPQHLSIFASVSNDSLASVAVALTIYLSARLCAARFRRNENASGGELVVLGLAAALCLLTKLTAYVAVPIAGLAVLGCLERKYVVQSIAAFAAFPVAAGGFWAWRNTSLYGPGDPLGLVKHDAIVVGQPLTGPVDFEAMRRLATIGFQSFWGQFGWMGVPMEAPVYAVLVAGSIVVALGFIGWLVRLARSPQALDTAGRSILLLLGLLGLLIAAGLLWYNLKYVQPQGRYLYAAMPMLALIFAAGLRTAFSRSVLPFLTIAVVGALMGLDYLALTRYIVPNLSPLR